jgi:oxysterol-binding protein 1
LEIFPQGVCHVILKGTNEHFTWKKVTTCVNNLIVGKLWIDHYGDMVVTNHSTGETCTLTFKAAGWRGKSQYEIEGKVQAKDGSAFELSGHWNDMLLSKNASTGENHLLWKRLPILENAAKNFNFTEFALSLNEICDGLDNYMCKTDSRLRPDQKAMEQYVDDRLFIFILTCIHLIIN